MEARSGDPVSTFAQLELNIRVEQLERKLRDRDLSITNLQSELDEQVRDLSIGKQKVGQFMQINVKPGRRGLRFHIKFCFHKLFNFLFSIPCFQVPYSIVSRTLFNDSSVIVFLRNWG